MLVITQKLHLNMLFLAKMLNVGYNIHSVALHLFAMKRCLLGFVLVVMLSKQNSPILIHAMLKNF